MEVMLPQCICCATNHTQGSITWMNASSGSLLPAAPAAVLSLSASLAESMLSMAARFGTETSTLAFARVQHERSGISHARVSRA